MDAEQLARNWTNSELAAMIGAVPVIDTADARLHCIAEGHGPPVLLVQGAGLVGEGWRPQVDGLRDRYTTVTLDNHGVGGSPLAPEPAPCAAALRIHPLGPQ